MRTFFSFAFISIFILICGCTFSVAWAQPKDLCAEKIIDSGTFEGIYAGVDCGDYCDATFILDNGGKYTLGCGEEEAEKYFGAIGNRVSVSYEIRQYWNDISDIGNVGCTRYEAVKDGSILIVGANQEVIKKREEQAKIEQENIRKWEEQERQKNQIQTTELPYKAVWKLNRDNRVFLTVTSVVDSLTIKKVIINRGNCIPLASGPMDWADEAAKNAMGSSIQDITTAMNGTVLDVRLGRLSERDGNIRIAKLKEKMKNISNINPFLPKILGFGDVLEIQLMDCTDVLEMQLETSQGILTNTFEPM